MTAIQITQGVATPLTLDESCSQSAGHGQTLLALVSLIFLLATPSFAVEPLCGPIDMRLVAKSKPDRLAAVCGPIDMGLTAESEPAGIQNQGSLTPQTAFLLRAWSNACAKAMSQPELETDWLPVITARHVGQEASNSVDAPETDGSLVVARLRSRPEFCPSPALVDFNANSAQHPRTAAPTVQYGSVLGVISSRFGDDWPVLLVIGLAPLVIVWVTQRLLALCRRHGERGRNGLLQWVLFTIRHFSAYCRHTLRGTYPDAISMTSIEIRRTALHRDHVSVDGDADHPWHNNDFLFHIVQDNVQLRKAIG